MSACATPVSFETFVAYWAGDLAGTESDEVEAHVFSCATCTAMSRRIAAVTETLRGLEPPVISAARLGELRAAGRRIEDNVMAPGGRAHIVFSEQDLIVHRLGGLDLAGVDRVGLVVRAEGADDVVAEVPSAPFDAASGEILVACQRHFAVFPPNVALEVTAYARGETKSVTRYFVEHEWALG